jgi:hypothetical protein
VPLLSTPYRFERARGCCISSLQVVFVFSSLQLSKVVG